MKRKSLIGQYICNFTQARKHVQLMHPRIETIITTPQGVQTVYSKHIFCDTNISGHTLLCCGNEMGDSDQRDIADVVDDEYEDDEKSSFSKYGTGVVLLFKFMAYMFTVFLLLTVLSIPSIYIFAESNAMADDMVTITQQMASVSLGNLGEGHTECNAGSEPMANSPSDEGSVHIGCPAGASIGSINAIYGDFDGVCGCPSQQTPKTSCPTAFPHLSSAREARMPNGARFKTTPCCSAELDSTGRPVFPDLQFAFRNVSSISGKPSCASESVQKIASMRCLGQASCTVSAQPNLQQAWQVSATSQCEQADGLRLTRTADGNLLCSNSLAAAGLNFCPSTPRRLVIVARCFSDAVALGPFGSYSKQEIAVAVALFDAFAVLVFILLVRNLTKREKKEAEFRSTTSIADYTVFIPSLPVHDTIEEFEQDLREFLEGHLNACEEVPMIHQDGQTDSSKALPVKVADINFGLSDTRLIAWNKLRGELLYKLETAEKTHLVLTQGQETYRKLKEWADKGLFEVGCCPAIRRHPYLYAKHAFDRMEKLVKQIGDVDEEIKIVLRGGIVASPRSPKVDEIEATHAKCAYVTFETAEAALRARREFSDSRVMAWCTRQYVKRNGGDDLIQAAAAERRPIPVMPEKYELFAIRTRTAPEPSDIVWENVGTPRMVRCGKQITTSLATMVFLFAIFILVFYLEDAKRGIQLEHPQVECSQFARIDDVQAAVYDEMLVLSDSYAASNPNKTRTGRMECFCQELLSNNSGNPLSLESFLFTVPYPEGTKKEALCWDWFQTFVSAQAITYGVAILTLALNSLAKPVIEWMVQHESRRSRGSQLYSLATKLFGFQVINTGLVVLFVNSYFETQWFFFGKGTYSDFDTAWYLGPGTSIIVTMFLMVFTPQLARLGRGAAKWVSICRDRNCSFNKNITHKITQNEFNKLFEGQSMDVSERYAQMLTVVFISLAYSSMLPILIPMAAMFFGLMMLAEIALFIYCYRTPPAFSPALAKSMSSLLVYAVPAHFAFGLWAMTNPDIFPSSEALKNAMDASMASNSTSSPLSFANAAQKGLQEVAALDSAGLEFSSRFESTAGIVLFVCFIVMASCLAFQAIIFRWIRQILVVIGKCCAQKRKLRRELPPLWETLPIADINAVIDGGRVILERRQKGHLWDLYKRAHSFNLRHQKASDVIDAALQRIKQLENEAYDTGNRQEALTSQIDHIEHFRMTAESRWRELRLTPDSDEKRASIDEVMEQLETYDAEVAGLKLQKQDEEHKLMSLAEVYDELNVAIQEAKATAATKEVVEKGADRIEGLASYSMQSHPEYASVFGFSVNIFDSTLSAQVQRSVQAERHAKQQVQLARQASVRIEDQANHTLKHLRSFRQVESASAANDPVPSPSKCPIAGAGLLEAADVGDVELVSMEKPGEVQENLRATKLDTKSSIMHTRRLSIVDEQREPESAETKQAPVQSAGPGTVLDTSVPREVSESKSSSPNYSSDDCESQQEVPDALRLSPHDDEGASASSAGREGTVSDNDDDISMESSHERNESAANRSIEQDSKRVD